MKEKRKSTEEMIRKLAESDQPLRISLTNDFAFKKAFHNKIALRGLLGALLHIPQEEICEIEFADTILPGEYEEEHAGILDIRVVLNGKRRINVELQTLRFPYWEERTIYYLSKMYAEGFEKGRDYSGLEECVHIGILDFDLYPNPPFYFRVGLWDIENRRQYSDKISLRVLELSKIEEATEQERQTAVYQWARLFAAKDWEVLRMLAENNESMKAAKEELEKINTDKELRYLYLRSERSASDETTIRNYYTKLGRDEGMKEGVERGLAEGKKESILEVLEEKGRISDSLREKISSEKEMSILSEWLKKAVRAESMEEFLRNIRKEG